MKTIRAYLCGCLYTESRRNENHKAIWQRKDKTEDAFLSFYKTKGICSQIPLTSFLKSSERVREPVSLSWFCRVWPGTSSLISLYLIKKKKLEVPVLQRYSRGMRDVTVGHGVTFLSEYRHICSFCTIGFLLSV